MRIDAISFIGSKIKGIKTRKAKKIMSDSPLNPDSASYCSKNIYPVTKVYLGIAIDTLFKKGKTLVSKDGNIIFDKAKSYNGANYKLIAINDGNKYTYIYDGSPNAKIDLCVKIENESGVEMLPVTEETKEEHNFAMQNYLDTLLKEDCKWR